MTAPVDEFARQRALDTYRVVDTLPEAAYDDIVRLASALCGAPIATISLIDRDRQWFKARVGMDAEETSRDVAVCDHAIREPDRLLEVANTIEDPRFRDFPAMRDDGIRFYAGMPLVTPSGAAIGTVCVLDHEPRQLNDQQRAGLAALARLTMNLLESGHREREHERAAQFAAAEALAEATPEPERPKGDGFSVGVFEVQDMLGASERIGDRALKAALEKLEHALEAGLRPGSGDSVSHAAGSGEFIVVMHGDDCSDPWRQLCGIAGSFALDSGIGVMAAAAEAHSASQSMAEVFLMADEALSREKDAARRVAA